MIKLYATPFKIKIIVNCVSYIFVYAVNNACTYSTGQYALDDKVILQKQDK